MNESGNRNSKQIEKVITFPIPFSEEENQKNTSNCIELNSKSSKQENITKALKFHSEGNIEQAKKYYQICISQGSKDPRIFANYGVILKNLNNFREAEIQTRNAIQINPQMAIAHYNLGTILKAIGNLKEAEKFTRKAIKLDSSYAKAYYNLGTILRESGNLKEAEINFRKAVRYKPGLAIAHYELASTLVDIGNLKEAEVSIRKAITNEDNLSIAHILFGTILTELGKSEEALSCYLRAIEIDSKRSEYYAITSRFLRDADPSKFDKKRLRTILIMLLKRNDIPPKEIYKAFNYLYQDKLKTFDNKSKLIDNETFEELIKDELLVIGVKKITFRDYEWESFLSKVREEFSSLIANNKKQINYLQLQFIIAIAEQCFFNEYIFCMSIKEDNDIKKIINRCNCGHITKSYISIIACYFPLYKLLDKIKNLQQNSSTDKNFLKLMNLQISEPLKEIELSKKIKKVGSIKDKISQKVKSQYEENPYPRWRYGNPYKDLNASHTQIINVGIKPNLIKSKEIENEIKILIAGCGTGNQILEAQRYKNAEITAIDLSSSSLSYAQRKINELGIINVKLFEMDILEVSLLKKKFDIIECDGVLHHMDDPLKGLKSLINVLNDNGFLKIGLYSEIARQDIVKARNYILNKKLKANKNDIRSFRKTIFTRKSVEINSLLSSPDFYTLSACRDLCFHSKEHRFTIPELKKIFDSHELKFLGFLITQEVKSLYQNYFPEDRLQTNLYNWEKFEKLHPITFRGCYRFWVSKKAD